MASHAAMCSHISRSILLSRLRLCRSHDNWRIKCLQPIRKFDVIMTLLIRTASITYYRYAFLFHSGLRGKSDTNGCHWNAPQRNPQSALRTVVRNRVFSPRTHRPAGRYLLNTLSILQWRSDFQIRSVGCEILALRSPFGNVRVSASVRERNTRRGNGRCR